MQLSLISLIPLLLATASSVLAAPIPMVGPGSDDTSNNLLQDRADGLYQVNITAPGSIKLYSNDPAYTAKNARADLNNIMAWAGDSGNLSPSQKTETLAALFDVAHRYYPELPTRVVCRVLMADIRAESDFSTNNVSPGRLDSGDSWGLMQVSQDGSKELTLFQNHARVSNLPDWSTGRTMNVYALTKRDLLRPWVNIHVATWIQANLGKTGSLDPYDWTRYQNNGNRGTGGLPRTLRTGFGSWVAGPHPDGYGSYLQRGDDASAPYLRAIMRSVNYLYGKDLGVSWLERWTLSSSLADYR
ncbi:hypothetical protein CF319_g992 [Tilletia indica]|nr:hypothetical protein CF319_g992 [Tilletia indica]